MDEHENIYEYYDGKLYSLTGKIIKPYEIIEQDTKQDKELKRLIYQYKVHDKVIELMENCSINHYSCFGIVI